MAVDDTLKARADKLIEVYLNWVLSTDTAAGWHQPSMLQSMIDYRGCLPQPDGNDQADLKMIREIEHLRRPHALLNEAKESIGRLPKLHRTCLLVHERSAGTYDRDGKRWTEGRIAGELGLTIAQYRHYRKSGHEKLTYLLEASHPRAA